MRRLVALLLALLTGLLSLPALAEFSGPGMLPDGSNATGAAATNFGPLQLRLDAGRLQAAGGSGYVAGQTGTLSGGTCAVPPTIIIWTAGVAPVFSVRNAGQCTVPPSDPVSFTTTSGSGAALTLAPYWVQFTNADVRAQSVQGVGGPNGESFYPSSNAAGVLFPSLGPTSIGFNTCGNGGQSDLGQGGTGMFGAENSCDGYLTGTQLTSGIFNDYGLGHNAGGHATDDSFNDFSGDDACKYCLHTNFNAGHGVATQKYLWNTVGNITGGYGSLQGIQNISSTISAVANNGSGLCRLTVPTNGTTGMTTGDAGFVPFSVGAFDGSSGVSTVAISIASPAIITWNGTNPGISTLPLNGPQPITFTSSGALPTGITAGATYYTIAASISGSNFKVATSFDNALAGIAVNTSGTQSGTPMAFKAGDVWFMTVINDHTVDLEGSSYPTNCPSTVISNTLTDLPSGFINNAISAGASNGGFYQVTIPTTINLSANLWTWVQGIVGSTNLPAAGSWVQIKSVDSSGCGTSLTCKITLNVSFDAYVSSGTVTAMVGPAYNVAIGYEAGGSAKVTGAFANTTLVGDFTALAAYDLYGVFAAGTNTGSVTLGSTGGNQDGMLIGSGWATVDVASPSAQQFVGIGDIMKVTSQDVCVGMQTLGAHSGGSGGIACLGYNVFPNVTTLTQSLGLGGHTGVNCTTGDDNFFLDTGWQNGNVGCPSGNPGVSDMLNIATVVAGDSGGATNPSLCIIGMPCVLGVLRTGNFNSTADQAITIRPLTSTGVGYVKKATKYTIDAVIIDNCPNSLTTAQGGLYTAASKGGVIIGATTTGYTSCTGNTVTNGTAPSQQLTSLTNTTTNFFNAPTLYLSLTNPQGGTATADVHVIGKLYNFLLGRDLGSANDNKPAGIAWAA